MMAKVGDVIRTTRLRTLALVRERVVYPEDVRDVLRSHRLAWHHGRQPTRVPITAIANLEQLAQPHGHDSGLDALKRFEEMSDELMVQWIRLAPGYAWAYGAPTPPPQTLALGRDLPVVPPSRPSG